MIYKSRLNRVAAELAIKLEAAELAAAEKIEQAAKERVPVATGKLHDAIHIEHDGDGYAVVAGDTEAFYGHIIEHGGVHTPPRPFLIPALEDNRAEILKLAAIALRSL